MLDREEIDRAWVGHLPSAFYRDPTPGNDDLLKSLAPFAHSFASRCPTIRPDWPKWEQSVRDAAGAGAPAIRAYPPQWGLGPHDARMKGSRLRQVSREWRFCWRFR